MRQLTPHDFTVVSFFTGNNIEIFCRASGLFFQLASLLIYIFIWRIQWLGGLQKKTTTPSITNSKNNNLPGDSNQSNNHLISSILSCRARVLNGLLPKYKPVLELTDPVQSAWWTECEMHSFSANFLRNCTVVLWILFPSWKYL